MPISKQALQESLFESIFLPHLPALQNLEPEIHHYKEQEYLPKFIAFTLSKLIDKQGNFETAVKKARRFLELYDVCDMDESIRSTIQLYNTIKIGFAQLNLQEESEENAVLLRLFKKIPIHTGDEFAKILDALIQHGIGPVCQLADQFHSDGILKIDYFFLCLTHFTHHKTLQKAFNFLCDYRNLNLRLLNNETLTLFNRAPEKALAIADLLLLLGKQKLYCPTLSSNPTVKTELITELDPFIHNVERILRDCKRNLSLGALNSDLLIRIIKNSNQYETEDFQKLNNLLNRLENTALNRYNILNYLEQIEESCKKDMREKDMREEEKIIPFMNDLQHNHCTQEENIFLAEKLSAIQAKRSSLSSEYEKILTAIKQLSPSNDKKTPTQNPSTPPPTLKLFHPHSLPKQTNHVTLETHRKSI